MGEKARFEEPVLYRAVHCLSYSLRKVDFEIPLFYVSVKSALEQTARHTFSVLRRYIVHYYSSVAFRTQVTGSII